MSETNINKNDKTINIELSQQEKNICAFSPIEKITYYFIYPKQLLKDALSARLNIYTYFTNIFNESMEYYYKKYNK